MPRARASVSRVEYVPEFGRTVRIAEFDRPMRSDDEETAQTVAYMDELAARDSNDPAVIAAVAEALDQAGIDASAPPALKAQAVYWWLKRTVRYVPTPGTSPLVDQTLIPPVALLAMPEPIGDCPQFSMLAAAMFRVLCMGSLFVTIAAERSFPDQWSHIYNTVELGPGEFMPFDSSNGPAPGAEYAKPYKRRVWAQLTPGRCRTKEGPTAMLRGTYRNAPTGMRSRTLRGALGAMTCDESGCYDDGSSSGPGELMTGPAPSLNDSRLQIDGSTGYGGGSPSGGGAPWWQGLINDAASIGTSLLKSQTQQRPYYVTSPTGQSVLYNPNTGSIGTPQTLTSAINPTYLVMGIAAIAALAFVGKK